MIRVIAVTPAIELPTKKSRAVLPTAVPRDDAVHNLQRSALFIAAIETRRYDLVWDAMQDRLHQHYRQKFIPGLADVLAMPPMPGLVGLALSGADPVSLHSQRLDSMKSGKPSPLVSNTRAYPPQFDFWRSRKMVFRSSKIVPRRK